MPVQTTTEDISIGMRLHKPVYAGTELVLRAGKELNRADIDFLRSKCPGIMISVEDPVLDKLIRFEDDTREWEVAHSTQASLVSAMTHVQTQYQTRLATRAFDIPGIESAVEGVLDYFKNSKKVGHTLTRIGRTDDYINAHTAHVFYLSLIVGNSVRARVAEARKRNVLKPRLIERDDLDLTPLALAALFMEIGMIPIKDVYNQCEPLSIEQIEMIRNHPITSAEMLPDDVPSLTRLLIETHHENYDGSGYPYGLKGDEIHVLARILRIADAYSAATADQVYREACSPVRALWEMTQGPFTQFYDPILLKIFTTLVQPYPIGARVLLNNEHYGVVVRHGAAKPFLPEIVVAFDEKGDRLPPDRVQGPIKLDQDPSLRIRAFNGEDVSDIYTDVPHIKSVTTEEFTSLYESMYTGVALARQS